MATAEKDPHLELKKRARRRLVGAVALALLAAIVLPMVMDQEPQPPNQDIQVRIPSRDSPFDGRVQPRTSPPVEQPPAAAQAPVVAKSPVDEGPAEPAPQSKAPPPAAPAEAVKPAQRERHAEPAPSKVADAPAEKLAKSEQASKDSKREEARAKAILSGEAETSESGPAAARSGQFIVQLGVFRDPGNARKVQARVKSEGYNAYTEQLGTGGGAKTRVRAGPFASRDSAEKAREKLKQQGLDGIVAPKS